MGTFLDAQSTTRCGRTKTFGYEFFDGKGQSCLLRQFSHFAGIEI